MPISECSYRAPAGDPRWGRGQETPGIVKPHGLHLNLVAVFSFAIMLSLCLRTPGEDPTLNAAYAAAFPAGMQGAKTNSLSSFFVFLYVYPEPVLENRDFYVGS